MSAGQDGPLASQAARDYTGQSRDDDAYDGQPSTGGHGPASDAVSPQDTFRGATVRDEIQQITDRELSGEVLTAQERHIRQHGEQHAVDMEVRPDDGGTR